MSDERLRELERRWTESEQPDDEADFLLELVRSGVLSEVRLELADCFGHPAASIAMEHQFPTLRDAEDWNDRLELFQRVDQLGGQIALVRFAIALSRVVIDLHEAEHHYATAEELLDAAEEWVLLPEGDGRRAVIDEQMFHADRWRSDVPDIWSLTTPVPLIALYQPDLDRGSLANQLRYVRRRVPDRLNVVSSELSSWALGRSDAVLARYQSRQS